MGNLGWMARPLIREYGLLDGNFLIRTNIIDFFIYF
jgi:hypothetical protein